MAKQYAVITGDMVNSTALSGTQKKKAEEAVRGVLEKYVKYSPYSGCKNYLIYRGDSFQSILTDPKRALEMSLLIKMALKMLDYESDDARISIGIGEVDQLTTQINDSDGLAFRYSGRTLEEMNTNNRLLITMKNSNKAKALNTCFILLDKLMMGWSAEMAEAVFYYIQRETQNEIAERLSISQPAVNKRLRTSGVEAVWELLNYYEDLIGKLK